MPEMQTEEIPERVFTKCKELKKITLPSTLKKINAQAFWGCESLTDVNFPENLVEIGKESFYGCKALKLVKINEGCKKLDNKAFLNWGAKGINRKIYLPSTIEEIGELALCSDYDYETVTMIYSPKNYVIQNYCSKENYYKWVCID